MVVVFFVVLAVWEKWVGEGGVVYRRVGERRGKVEREGGVLGACEKLPCFLEVKTVVYRARQLSEAEKRVDCEGVSTCLHTIDPGIYFHCMMMQANYFAETRTAGPIDNKCSDGIDVV